MSKICGWLDGPNPPNAPLDDRTGLIGSMAERLGGLSDAGVQFRLGGRAAVGKSVV